MPLTEITWQDVQQFPDDGKRYEAIEGELYVTAAPSIRHQRISRRLERALYRLLHDPGHGEVLHAAVGVEFPGTGEGVQPDIVFVSAARAHIVEENSIHGAPDLVIEILSPSTASRDLKLKLRLYERQGVGEYWVVDPDEDDVTVWRFGAAAEGSATVKSAAGHSAEKGSSHGMRERFTDRLPVRVGREIVGEIDLEEMFRRG